MPAPCPSRIASYLTRLGVQVTYRVQGGLRHVEPASIEAGRVTVDGKAVKSGHVLRDGQRIVHRAVRCRENPVLDRGPIKVVAETKALLVVSKPSSLPIHPCGSYRFNSLIAILRNQGTVEADAALHTTHRLDRLTSGLVLLAKTKESARRVGAWFAANQIRKTYLARVQGRFEQLLKGGDLPVGATCKDGRIHVAGFIRCIDRKVGRYEFSAEAPKEAEKDSKDAATEFEFVGMASEDESIGGEQVMRYSSAHKRASIAAVGECEKAPDV
ncbi:RIB2 [Symbiodinium natans]|uniref:RIB2 protein n=1 Tax=Symbiodinium natans TaxID=878477 RepID=A0A812V8V9_9DINO|nr:RIB2 [Symbiodinium natans]